MEGPDNRKKERLRLNALVYSGLLGVGVVSIVQLLSVQDLVGTLPWSVRCFALSIPFLAASVIIENDKALDENVINSSDEDGGNFGLEWAANMIGMVFTALGVVLLFFYLDLAAGILMTVAAIIAFTTWWRAGTQDEEAGQ